jgi:hypothetical protein
MYFQLIYEIGKIIRHKSNFKKKGGGNNKFKFANEKIGTCHK